MTWVLEHNISIGIFEHVQNYNGRTDKTYVLNRTKNKCIQTEKKSFELQANVEKNTHRLKSNC